MPQLINGKPTGPRIQLERQAYAEFKKKFSDGKFKAQRLGQAFYTHFKMEKVISVKGELDRIYQLDGAVAENAIKALVSFN